ncbi:MAG: hypothetical protein AAGI07_04325 [Bacteroidota bacterium]
MKYSQSSALVLSIIAILIVMSPIIENWKEKPEDSFPLSYYPMFSKKRKEVYSMYYFVGYDSQDNRHKIPYKIVGTGGFNQVRRQIRRAARSDNPEALTHKVVHNIAKRKDYPFTELVKIELVKGYYHLENYFLKNDTLPVRESFIASQLIEK